MNAKLSQGGARARAREAMRAQVAAIATELVLDKGYEQTTVDDICHAADVSRSTFFRYFPTKDEALLSGTADAGERLLAALTDRPDSESVWVALRRALDTLIIIYEAEDESTRRLTRLIMTTPPLALRHREKNDQWLELLRPEVARRLDLDASDATDPLPRAVIGAALGCAQAALAAWIANPEPQRLAVILDRAMSVVALPR